jgi:hypothetical protein
MRESEDNVCIVSTVSDHVLLHGLLFRGHREARLDALAVLTVETVPAVPPLLT